MSDVPSPKASRQALPRWLDPKLILGVLLVLASMALGARVIAQADDTVAIWALKEDLAPQATLDSSSLVVKRVRFSSQDDANQYVPASSRIPAGARMVRAVGKGEFLPRNSFTRTPDQNLKDIPIPVELQNTPAGLRANDRVDLYVVPKNTNPGVLPPGTRYLTDVVVTSVSGAGGLTSGANDTRMTIRLAVDPAKVNLDRVVGAVVGGTPVIVRRVEAR